MSMNRKIAAAHKEGGRRMALAIIGSLRGFTALLEQNPDVATQFSKDPARSFRLVMETLRARHVGGQGDGALLASVVDILDRADGETRGPLQ